MWQHRRADPLPAKWLPGWVRAVTQARKIDVLIGQMTAGDWADEEVIQGSMELTGLAVPYGDYTERAAGLVELRFRPPHHRALRGRHARRQAGRGPLRQDRRVLGRDEAFGRRPGAGHSAQPRRLLRLQRLEQPHLRFPERPVAAQLRRRDRRRVDLGDVPGHHRSRSAPPWPPCAPRSGDTIDPEAPRRSPWPSRPTASTT